MSQVVRQVVERVRVARQTEEQARTAAEAARIEREKVERQLRPAQKRAQAVSEEVNRQARHRLAEVEKLLAQAEEAAAADKSVPQPSMRVRARMLLLGGTASPSADEPYSAAQAITSIVTLDNISGALHDCQQRAGRLMQWLSQQDVDDDSGLWAEADRLECMAWSGLKRRIVHLAGEDML